MQLAPPVGVAPVTYGRTAQCHASAEDAQLTCTGAAACCTACAAAFGAQRLHDHRVGD